jgi:hypothetical protein
MHCFPFWPHRSTAFLSCCGSFWWRLCCQLCCWKIFVIIFVIIINPVVVIGCCLLLLNLSVCASPLCELISIALFTLLIFPFPFQFRKIRFLQELIRLIVPNSISLIVPDSIIIMIIIVIFRFGFVYRLIFNDIFFTR